MCSQATVFQELYGGKTEISRQVSKCSLVSLEGLEVMTVNIEEGKYRGGEICVYRDTEWFGIVVPVFGGC